MHLLTSIKRRWDSSDPDRAPPPLPLNPGSQVSPTKTNVSSGIAAAAKQIVEKARESAPLSAYTSNRETPSTSPDRSLVKGAQHKRLQSLQTNSVKDLRSYLDNRSPERSPERPLSASEYSLSHQNSRENISSPLDRSNTPTPSRDPLKDTPTLRPSARSPTRPLLGRENTPPSATMLALQTMQVPDPPLNDITNGPSTPTPSRPSTTYDFSSQLLNLTSIANGLQREMAQLSRRSKDNATDLISLKEATSKRDEDIRKSLRELTTSISLGGGLLGPPPVPGAMSRSASSFGNYLDSKPFSTPPSAAKLPRAASANGFVEDMVGSPSPYSVEGAASVAMLEKIIREMVTKEGQERLQSSLSELLEKSQKENSQAARKVEELSDFIKEKSQSHALVPFSKDSPPKLDLNFDSPGAKTRDAGGKEAKMIGLDDELMKMLQRIKDSVAHSGGTSSEVKGLVRDLRGEVLGMGRELGKKLDTVTETQLNNTLDRSIEDGQGKVDAEEVHRIIEDGMAELKEHLSATLKKRAEQDDSAFKQLATRGGPDSDEMFAVVKHALAEHGGGIATRDFATENNGVDRETVLEAVKEGLKDFEPNIELQQFGLERDEILTVLKEGLEGYQKDQPGSAAATIDKGEIYEAMHEAFKDFRPPIPQEQIDQMKDDMLGHVRQALLEYMPESAGPARTDEATRMAIIDAVKDAVASHGASAPRELEISREDLFDAVKASLDGSSIPFGGLGEQVITQLHELIDGMRVEFKEYTAANGRDTEQVLDAVKDGLESLRAGIESYVDRAQDVTGKDEIVDTVKTGLEQLRADVQGYVSQGPAYGGGRDDMLEYIKLEFENLHRAIGSRDADRDFDGCGFGEQNSSHTAGILFAIKDGMDELKNHVSSTRGTDDEEGKEEMLEAMKEEFEQLKIAVLNANAHDKSELIETIQDSMGVLHAKVNGSQVSGLGGGATEDIINEIHAEFNQLKETLHSIIGDADREAIITGIRHSIDDLRVQLSADQSDASAESLGAIKEELERFRVSMASSGTISRGLDDETSTIKSGLDDLKDTVSKSVGAGVSHELLEAIRGEFENLRNSIATGSVAGSQTEEVLDEVRVGLDDLRNHVDKKFDNPDHATKQHGDLLDAINDGIETMRTDIVKTLDKPLDMTVNYEILDTLKDGLLSLRADIDKLRGGDGASVMPKGGEIVLADETAVGETRDIHAETNTTGASAASGTARAGLDKIEVLLAQLQIKVEAVEATVQDLPGMKSSHGTSGPAMKDDIVVLEVILKEVQDGIASIASKGGISPGEGVAKKEDTDAIETLLRNTKGQLEDMAFPDPANVITKDQLDAVEAVVRVTNEGIDGLADKLENSTAAKADVAVVEVLAQDVKTALEEVRDRLVKDDKPDLMTKADLDVLGIMVTEIRTRINEMVLPDPDETPSKAEMEQLHGLITDFRESHDKMRDSYDKDIAVTAKAFDDRRQEFEDTVEQISQIKKSLADIKDDMLAKMGEGEYSIDDLGGILKNLEETTGPVNDDLKGLVEKVTLEFDRAHASLDLMKLDQQQYTESSLEKQAEHKDALVHEIGEKLETYFDGLMSKYDDAQRAAEEKAKLMEENAAQQEELLSSMKGMAEELRLSIDTLGTTLTSFPETIEKIAAESNTMFNKVDDTYNKLDETQAGLKYEHSVTRDEIAKVLATVGGLQSDLSEHNPRFLIALGEVQALIGQHYEHSQKASDAAAEHAKAVKDLQEQIRGIGAQNEELKTDVSSLPRLMPAPSSDSVPAPEKYDDRAVHEKLDKLMNHADEASGATFQLERLDQIHEKVMATAAEVSAFVATQTKQIAADHESKEKETEELALLLERRQVQKDEIEDDITVLNEEKDSLRAAVETLKAEKEALAAQKARLTADVSSLETAMHIRREELHDMDRKAEAIERRMLEGVMNQSRVLLLAKTTKSAPKKKPQGRDLRIPSSASAASAQTVTSSLPALKANHALAMKARPVMQRNGPIAHTAERRIMSLNQINHNVPTGASAFSPAPSIASRGAPQSLKRSHSVKTQIARKPSWGGKRHMSLAEQNKENETLSEVSEDELQRPEHHDMDSEDAESRAGTERRTSGTSRTRSLLTHTDAEGSVADGISPSIDEDGRASYGTSKLSFGTGSYITGSEVDRHTSFGSSANGVLGGSSVVDEDPNEEFHELDEPEDEEEQAVAGAQQERPLEIELAPPAKLDMQIYAPPSDSGLGTDAPPTAGALSTVGEYFP